MRVFQKIRSPATILFGGLAATILIGAAAPAFAAASAPETAAYAGFRHHFYRNVPNRGLPAWIDAREAALAGTGQNGDLGPAAPWDAN